MPFLWIVGRTFLSNLVRRRALLLNLVMRDFQQRYVGSAVGWLWGGVQPAVLLLSYTFVFGRIFQVKPPTDSRTSSFALWLFAGIVPWLLFQEAVQRSVTAVVDYSNLITKTMFPSEMLPLAMFLSGLINHALALVVLLVIAGIAGTLTPLALLLPLYLLLLALFSVGISWVVSSLHVFLRDTSHAFSIVLIFWFWFTPIFYTADRLPRRLHFLARVNPLAYVVEAYRGLVGAGPAPRVADLGLLALFALGVFFAGGLFFRYTKRAFGDVL